MYILSGGFPKYKLQANVKSIDVCKFASDMIVEHQFKNGESDKLHLSVFVEMLIIVDHYCILLILLIVDYYCWLLIIMLLLIIIVDMPRAEQSTCALDGWWRGEY